jgi:hypothetical protein
VPVQSDVVASPVEMSRVEELPRHSAPEPSPVTSPAEAPDTQTEAPPAEIPDPSRPPDPLGD